MSRYVQGGARFVVLAATAAQRPTWAATLTPAERAVLSLVARGLSNAEMAAIRGCGVPTIVKQLAGLKRKSGCTERHALARLARRLERGKDLPPAPRGGTWGRGGSS